MLFFQFFLLRTMKYSVTGGQKNLNNIFYYLIGKQIAAIIATAQAKN